MSENRDALMQEAVRRGVVKDQPTTSSDPMRAEAQRRGLIPSAETYGPPVPPRQEPQLPPTLRQAWPSAPPESFAGEAQSALRQGRRELWQGTGNLVSNFFRSLVPGEAGARAGGDVMRQLGDIGQFASGGLTSPIAIPQQAAGLARGFNIPPPRQAEMPRAPLALPPPDPLRTPGTPPISTGEGMIPRRQPGTMTSPTATPGGVGGPPPRPPEPPSPRPPEQPSARARTDEAVPRLITYGAERGPPSQLAGSLVINDARGVDSLLTNRFRRAIKPGRQGPMTGPRIDAKDQNITTAADTIIDNVDQIRFRDPRDPSRLERGGRLPRTLGEFAQAITQIKTQIYEQYTNLAGRTAARVDLTPVVAKLREMAQGPEMINQRSIAQAALDLADEYAMKGSYSPVETQHVIESLNKELHGLLSGKAPSSAVFSHPTMMNQVRDTLLNSLNSTMERALGDPRYQTLRLREGSLLSIEENVGNALHAELAKTPGWVDRSFTVGELIGLASGATFFDPKVMGVTAATAAGRRLYSYLNSPNYAVRTMFNRRSAALAPTYPTATEIGSARLGSALGDIRQGAYDRRPAYVGTAGP